MLLDDDALVAVWKRRKELIDKGLERVLVELPEAVAVDVAKYIVEGGKRLRGFLVIEVAEALGGKAEKALDAAVAIELVHAASLALDDIIDNDYVRRGKPAAWIAFGIPKTVMVSNLLIPYAQRIVFNSYGVEALRRTVNAWLDVSRGEVLDAFIPLESMAPEMYVAIVRLKTAALFRLAAELGAIAAGKNNLADELGRYGEILGVAYQFADDIVDAVREERGEEVAETKGYILFKRYCKGDIAYALRKLRELVEEAVTLSHKLFGETSTVLTRLPVFMVKAMLSEVGLENAAL